VSSCAASRDSVASYDVPARGAGTEGEAFAT
jgi:hypothetical protein